MTTLEQVKRIGNIYNVSNDKLNIFIERAIIELKRLLGSEKYLDIESKPDSNDYAICSLAEAYFTNYFCLLALNTQTTGDGIVSSVGYAESKQTLLSTNETLLRADFFKNEAIKLLTPFINKKENDYITNAGITLIAIN